MKRLRKLESHEKIFVAAWFCYIFNYPGRFGYGAAIVAIGAAEGYTTEQLGIVASVLFASYGIFQLIGGRLGDKVNPALLVSIGLAGSAACNVMLGLSGSILMMEIAELINGAFCCIIWAPLVRQLNLCIPNEKIGNAMLKMQYCTAIGMCLTFLLVSLFTALFHWRVVFFVIAALLLLASAVWGTTMHRLRGKYEIQIQPTVLPKTSGVNDAKKLYIKSGFVFLLVIICLMGFIQDGIQTWMPTSLSDTFGTGVALSIFMSAGLPILKLSGTVAVKWLRKKRPDDDLFYSTVLFGAAGVFLILIALFGSINPVLTTVLFSLVCACLFGISTAMIYLLPIKFAPYGRSSTVAGISNSLSYLGSALAGFGIGALAGKTSWSGICIILMGLCLLGALFSVVLRPIWNCFSRKAADLSQNESTPSASL